MVYYPELYFLDKHEASQYSQKPPGHLKVDRLIRDQASWKKSGLSSARKQKSLILADWTAAQWSTEKIEDVKKLLSKLLDDGFPIFLWHDDQVEELTKNSLNSFNKTLCSKIKPNYPNVITDAAVKNKQHRLTKNQIHILDDYWINLLLSDIGELPIRLSDIEELPIRELSIEKLRKYPHGRKLVLSILQQATPPLSSIVHEEYSKRDNQLTLEVIRKYPSARLVEQYNSLICDENLNTNDDNLYPEIMQYELTGIQRFKLLNRPRSIKTSKLLSSQI